MQPSQPPASSSAAGSASKVPLNGLFRNGTWHCNCQPRLPAVQFTARRDTKNRGRTFYTCQLERGKGNKCDFFLWSEDARAREVGALISNSRSEAETPSRRKFKQVTLHESITPRSEKRHWAEKTPISGAAELADLGITRAEASETARSSSTLKASTSTRQDDIDDHGSSSEEDEVRLVDAGAETGAAEQKSPSAGSKRKRSDEEYSDFSSGEEEELVALTDRSSRGRFHDALATPVAAARSVNVEDGMPTPVTRRPVRRVLFADPEVNTAKRQRTDDGSASAVPHPHNHQQQQQSDTSPSSSLSSSSSSSQQQQQQQQQPPTPGTTDAADVTHEVMALLRGQKIDESVLRAVRGTLDRHAARARGLERGRDASREAVRKAEARAARLQQRVAELENARTLDAEARRKMRTELMKIYRDS
ncbi:hypothetical protein F5X99DRAFT_292849 [Biscogniauxia marginata]|nr:hypothetical protein F5X99DRAFT_292849 [Biscogniauxia marginata]